MIQTSPDIYPLELALQPRQAATHCSYCAVQCAMELSETPLGTVEAKGLPHPVNAGKLCVLGQSSAALLNHTERLTQPLVRIGGDLTPVSWEAALGYAAFRAVSLGYRRWRGREGLGAGDAKLLAAGGAWVGLEALSSAVLIGAVLGLCGAAALVRPGRAGWGATRVPFGPSLALGIWGVRLGLGFAPT